ncbi:MAG TPA: GTPase [Longimicrobium sp.]|nr:GTPase [Longimicrobium sp.]
MDHLEDAWPPQHVAALEKFRREFGQRKFYFLSIGRTGVGKSSTINSLVGQPVATSGNYEATTAHLEFHEFEIHGIPFVFIDTPGLADSDLEDSDGQYLVEILRAVSHIDCLWFVTRLDETRISSDELRALQLLTQAFGARVWEKALIVFTFADNIHPERYRETIIWRSNLLRSAIARYASSLASKGIPTIAVTNTAPTRPDGTAWVGEFFSKVVLRMSEDSAIPFFLGMRTDVVRNETPVVPKLGENYEEKPVDPGLKFARAELQRIYGQTSAQAIYWYRFSLVAAALGFVIFATGIVLLLLHLNTEGIVTLLSSVLPSITAALFFTQSKSANARVDAIQIKLTETQKLQTAIEVARSITNSEAQDRIKAVIVERILRETTTPEVPAATGSGV